MNRWFFWVLAPVMLATGFGLPLITNPSTVPGKIVLYLFSGTLLLAMLGLANPRRFQWALRMVAAAILLAYVAYAATEAVAWWHGKSFGLVAARSEPNFRNALWGLLVFGLPSLYFILKGRSGTAVDVLLDIEDDASRRAGVPSNKDEVR
jgi:hypothetical protein